MSVFDPLDLRMPAVNHYWRQRGDALHAIVRAMDEVEPWVVDDDIDVEDMLIGVMGSIGAQALAHASMEHLLPLLAYTRSSRALRTLSWVSDAHPEVLAKWLEAVYGMSLDPSQEGAPDGDLVQRAAHIVLERFISIQKQSILASAFSTRTMVRLSHAMRNVEKYKRFME